MAAPDVVAPPPPPESEPIAENGVAEAEESDTTDARKKKLTAPAAVHSKRPLNLNELTSEIQANIVRHIYRKSDLKSLCLVSKRLYDVAVKDLYHLVEFDIRRQEMSLSGLISHQNRGLKYIRIFRVYYEARNGDMPDSDHTHAHSVVRLIVNAIPENSLEDFEWSPWFPFSQETYLNLIHRQKRLKWLTAFRLDEDSVIEELEAKADENVDLFKNCHKVSVYPDSVATLELGQYYISKMSKLTALIVHANFNRGIGAHLPPREINDGPTGPGLITRTLFKDQLPFDKCTPFSNLTSLTLSEVSLRHCADTWMCFIDFTQVKVLRIAKCPGADALLTMLCKSKHLPRQLQMLEFQHEDNVENDALTSLDGFMCIVEGIQELYIDLCNVKSLPEVDGIVKHGKTLEILVIHACEQLSQDELVYAPDEFQRICIAATKLEQISCAWPSTSILRSSSPTWESFHFSTRLLTHLVTLHISTPPTYSPLKTPLDKQTYIHLLRALSTTLLTSHLPHPTSLRIIAFGTSDKISVRQDPTNQVIYLKSVCVNAGGKEETMAVQVGWGERRGIELRSDVLDFEAMKKGKLPVRDFQGFMDEDDDDDLN